MHHLALGERTVLGAYWAEKVLGAAIADTLQEEATSSSMHECIWGLSIAVCLDGIYNPDPKAQNECKWIMRYKIEKQIMLCKSFVYWFPTTNWYGWMSCIIHKGQVRDLWTGGRNISLPVCWIWRLCTLWVNGVVSLRVKHCFYRDEKISSCMCLVRNVFIMWLINIFIVLLNFSFRRWQI